MKKRKKYLYLMIVISIVVLFIVILRMNINKFNFKKEFEQYNGTKSVDGNIHISVSINSNEKIYLIDWNDLKRFHSEKKDGIIFIGSPTCEYCRSEAEIIANYTSNNGALLEIYYLRNKDIDYNEILGMFGGLFTNENIDKGVVIFLINGEAVSYNFGTISSHKNPYVPLDDDQKKGLESIYMNGINLVLESIQIKNNNYKNT